MVDPATPPSTRVRAAESVLTHAAKAIEIEDLEARVSDLERAAEPPRLFFPVRSGLGLAPVLRTDRLLLTTADKAQWAVVGDTFPVGCAYSDKVVYPEYFKNNPDFFWRRRFFW